MDVGYRLALKLINKPYSQKFEMPLNPGTGLREENIEYRCHHSIRDEISDAQLDALAAISRKLKDEMFKEALKRELMLKKGKELEKLFINMNKKEQEDHLKEQYEAQMKKYLHISSQTLSA